MAQTAFAYQRLPLHEPPLLFLGVATTHKPCSAGVVLQLQSIERDTSGTTHSVLV